MEGDVIELEKDVIELEEDVIELEEDVIELEEDVKETEEHERVKTKKTVKQRKKSEVHICTICHKTYNTRKYLQRHTINLHGDKRSKYPCQQCGKSFAYPNKLTEHERVHTGEKPFKCDVCDKTFRVPYTLKTHKLTHTDSRPFECAFCEYACRDSSTLRKHEARHTHTNTLFQCRKCDKIYKSKHALKSHVSDIHLSLSQRVECDICHNTYKNNYNLALHKRNVHERANTGSCQVCGAHIVNMNNYAAHLQTHSAARPYSCRRCGRAFNTKANLAKHSHTHRRSHAHTCPERSCSRVFARRSRRDKHVRMHAVRCRLCESSFPNQKRLSRHMLLAHSGRQFVREPHRTRATHRESSEEVTVVKEEMLEIEEHDLLAALHSAEIVHTEGDLPLDEVTSPQGGTHASARNITAPVKSEPERVEDATEVFDDDDTHAQDSVIVQLDAKLPPQFPERRFRREFLRRVTDPRREPAPPKYLQLDESKLQAQRRDIERALERARHTTQRDKDEERARRNTTQRNKTSERARRRDNAMLRRTLKGEKGPDQRQRGDAQMSDVSDSEMTHTDADVTQSDAPVRRSGRLRDKPKRKYCTFDKYGEISDDEISDDDVLESRNNSITSSRVISDSQAKLNSNLLLPNYRRWLEKQY